MPNDTRRTILRNMLLGKWAAEKLGLKGPEADNYTAALAGGTGHPEHGDVFSKLRKDFDAAGVAQSDQQILDAMHELMLKAGNHLALKRGSSGDGAAVALVRNLTSR